MVLALKKVTGHIVIARHRMHGESGKKSFNFFFVWVHPGTVEPTIDESVFRCVQPTTSHKRELTALTAIFPRYKRVLTGNVPVLTHTADVCGEVEASLYRYSASSTEFLKVSGCLKTCLK